SYTVETLTGKHSFLTEEGTIFIEVKGDMVLVSESLDQDTTTQVERQGFTQGATRESGRGPRQIWNRSGLFQRARALISFVRIFVGTLCGRWCGGKETPDQRI